MYIMKVGHDPLFVILLEASSCAQVHAAASADGMSLHPVVGPVTALRAIAFRFGVLCVVLMGQCDRSIGPSACLRRLAIGSEQLHQGVHELFSEIELLRPILANRPELECVDDAHIDEPPCQARPGLLALPSNGVGVVQLIAHIDGASAVKVVSDGAGSQRKCFVLTSKWFDTVSANSLLAMS